MRAAATLAGCATRTVSQAEPETLIADAQRTFGNLIRDPDQTWIQGNLSRARGVFGGPNLDGTVISTNVPWNDAFFGGSNLLPPDILIRRTVTSPKATALLADVAKATK